MLPGIVRYEYFKHGRLQIGEGHSLAGAIVHNDKLYVFASRFENRDWNDVTLFKSADLLQWESKVVIRQEKMEHLFNSSVCKGPEGFVMAYETNDPSWPALRSVCRPIKGFNKIFTGINMEQVHELDNPLTLLVVDDVPENLSLMGVSSGTDTRSKWPTTGRRLSGSPVRTIRPI